MVPSSMLARVRPGAVAALSLALGCGGSDLLLPGANQPAAIAVVKGDGQSGVAGGILAESLVVKVTDATSRPVAQVRVAFVPDAGGGRTQPDTVVTDNSGNAAALWILGTQSGSHKVQANVVGSSQIVASFTANISAGTPAHFQLVSGNAQTAPAGAALSSALVVKALDAQGNPVPGIVVSWSVTGGGAVNPVTSTTGSDGTASTQRTLGPVAGAQTTIANAGDIPGSPITFSATATSGSAGQLSITTQPAGTATVGQTLTTQPQVQLRDNLGNPVAQAGIAVTASLGAGSPAGGTLNGQLTQPTDATGLATFTDLAIGGATGAFTLSFSGANLAAVTSTQITVTSGAPSATLSGVSASPGTVAIGAASTITVTVRDVLGNLMPGVSVTPAADDPSGTLTPGQGTTGANGTVTFSFKGTKVRTYRISAQAGGVAIVQSASVQVTKAPTTTTITSDNPDPSLVTQPVTVVFTVTSASGTPSGNVTVSDGQVSCSAGLTVIAGVPTGQCNISPISVGNRTITASYPGNDVFAASSGTASHRVSLINTSTAITGAAAPSGNSPSFPTDPVVVSYSVTSVLGTPPGNVTVSDGSVSCTASAAAQQCTLTPTSAGQKTLTATFAAQGSFGASSGTLPYLVVLAPTATLVTPTPNPATSAQDVTISAQVFSQFQAPFSGKIVFGDGGSCPSPATTLGTKNVDNTGAATLTVKKGTLSVGNHSIIGCYTGSSVFAPSASAPVGEQITSNN
jgi:hypothetical protein